MIACAPLIANAVDNGLGIRIKDMPVIPEKIALRYKEKMNNK